jgi:hypothetical protein
MIQTKPNFQTWFAGSKVNTTMGPLATYHGSAANIRKFRPMSHFGTYTAATDRLTHLSNSDGNIICAYLRITNPVIFTDKGWHHTPAAFLNDLAGSWKFYEQLEQLKINEQTMDEKIASLSHRSFAPTIAMLSDIGFDGVVYRNLVEDPDSLSWCVFRGDQVWQIDNQHFTRNL